MTDFARVPLTKDTHIEVWHRGEDHQAFHVEVWDSEVPDDEEGRGKSAELLARISLDNDGRHQLIDALRAAPGFEVDIPICPVCTNKGGPISVSDGDITIEHKDCPDCGRGSKWTVGVRVVTEPAPAD